MRHQDLLRFVVRQIEQLLDLFVYFARCLFTAIALNLEFLPVQKSRLTLSAMSQAQALTHSVHCDHLAREGSHSFKIVLRAGTDFIEYHLLSGAATK